MANLWRGSPVIIIFYQDFPCSVFVNDTLSHCPGQGAPGCIGVTQFFYWFSQPQCIFYENPASPENFQKYLCHPTEILKNHPSSTSAVQQYRSTTVQQYSNTPAVQMAFYRHPSQIFFLPDTGVHPGGKGDPHRGSETGCFKGKYFGQKVLFLPPPCMKIYLFLPCFTATKNDQRYIVWSHLARSVENFEYLVLTLAKMIINGRKTGKKRPNGFPWGGGYWPRFLPLGV